MFKTKTNMQLFKNKYKLDKTQQLLVYHYCMEKNKLK